MTATSVVRIIVATLMESSMVALETTKESKIPLSIKSTYSSWCKETMNRFYNKTSYYFEKTN